MSDIEKVTKGLEMCRYSSKTHCDSCPYSYEGLVSINECTSDLALDALELLKERSHPDCEHAEHDGAGCLGYSGCHDDEPIDACKNCKKYTGNVT